MKEKTPDYKTFGEEIFKYLNDRGWNSLSKKEMLAMLVHHGIENNLLSEKSIFVLSVKLKVNPAGVRRILEDRALLMNRVEKWDIDRLITWLKENDQSSQDDINKGLGVYYINDWAERISAETALEKLMIIPDYKNNSQLLVIDVSKVVFQLSRIEGVNAIDLVKELLNKNKIELETFKEAEFNADPGAKLKEILKEQVSKKLGNTTTATLAILFKSAWRKIYNS